MIYEKIEDDSKIAQFMAEGVLTELKHRGSNENFEGLVNATYNMSGTYRTWNDYMAVILFIENGLPDKYRCTIVDRTVRISTADTPQSLNDLCPVFLTDESKECAVRTAILKFIDWYYEKQADKHKV